MIQLSVAMLQPCRQRLRQPRCWPCGRTAEGAGGGHPHRSRAAARFHPRLLMSSNDSAPQSDHCVRLHGGDPVQDVVHGIGWSRDRLRDRNRVAVHRAATSCVQVADV